MLNFILIDYSFEPDSPTVVHAEEPIGWEDLSIKLRRDFIWHSILDYWDEVVSNLQWHGQAFYILSQAYNEFGINSNVSLEIRYNCNENNISDILYTGKFNFSSCTIICGPWCRIQLGMEGNKCLFTLRNRWNQKVNLSQTKSFDSVVADLLNYSHLGFPVLIPPKPVRFTNDWEILDSNINYVDSLLLAEPTGTSGAYFFGLPWLIDNTSEITKADRSPFIYSELDSVAGSPAENFRKSNNGVISYDLDNSLICEGAVSLNIVLLGNLSIASIDTISYSGVINLVYGNDVDGYTTINLQTGLGCLGCNTASHAISISDSFTGLHLKKGDRIFLYYLMTSVSYSTGGGGGTPSDPFELSIHIDNASLKITVDSTCTPTPAKVYMINEVLSRLTEAYTGDCLRVYSDYFGRVDAQPYPSAVNGCGALACITSGLKIRTKDQGFIRIGDSEFTPGFTLSMRECFDALNAIHNIGMGIEPDLVRNDGSDWLRIEPMEYFYRDDVLLTCTGIRELRREFDPIKAFDRATIGYSNWETESVNGLNDVFGKREYRTSLKQLRNLYERLCPFIASDYAIEITRRQYGNTTKDWRYDNDTFIICLRNGSLGTARFQGPHTISVNGDYTDTLQAGDSITITGSGFNNGTFTLASFSFDGAATDMVMVEAVVSEVGSSGVLVVDETHPFYTVEQNTIEPGGSTANILYPEYCYNLRITPARNALRHTKTLMSGYGNNWADKQVLFSAGDGNYVAILDLKENDCTIEQDGALLENGNISVDTVIDENSIKPIYTAERVTFEYPVSYEQYKTIKANPYGLIGYQCGGGDVQYGYIEDFSYKPAQGIAEFTLRPKL